MPRYEEIVTVFVASPSDVKEERDVPEELVSDLNNTWSKTLGIRLELVKWETHAFPGRSSEPQEVINRQIGDDYDIFIGILWKRFGTPTGRAESGTAEEFERACRRSKEASTTVKVMIYFKDAAVAPSQIDLQQLTGVKNFQKRAAEAGCLYWSYSTLEEFRRLLQMHLSHQVQEFNKQPSSEGEPRAKRHELAQNPIAPTPSFERVDSLGVEEEGFLDLVEKALESLKITTEVGHRLAGIMEEYGTKMADYAQQINALGSPVQLPDVKSAKQIINRAAEAMEILNQRLEAEIPIFRKSYSTGVDAFGKAAVLTTDFETDNTKEIGEALGAVRSLSETFANARKSLVPFRQVLQSLPRLTTQFNRAKRRCIEIIGGLDVEIATAVNLTRETEKLIESLLQNRT